MNQQQPMLTSAISADAIQEILLAARYGDLDDLDASISASGISLSSAAVVRSLTASGGHTPLHMAAANGHAHILARLLPALASVPKEAGVDAKNDEGSTALHWAVLNGRTDAVSILLEHGARADERNQAGKSALTLAIQADHAAVADLLLRSLEQDDADGTDALEQTQLNGTDANGDDADLHAASIEADR